MKQYAHVHTVHAYMCTCTFVNFPTATNKVLQNALVEFKTKAEPIRSAIKKSAPKKAKGKAAAKSKAAAAN